jgi:hypothetical protein
MWDVSLWVEHAHKSLSVLGQDVCSDVVRTFQTEEQFFALLASAVPGRDLAAQVADKATAALRRGSSPEAAAQMALAGLERGTHVALSILQALKGNSERAAEACVVECDAPPLFLVQDGQPVLLPVVEEVILGRLVRQCQFSLQDGDHLAMVGEGFLRPRGWRWGWPDIAVAVRRWTDLGCDAGELLGALLRTYQRLNPEPPQQDVTVVAMHVRPMRTATVWTGPPADSAQDEAALQALMAEQGERVICGGTTAQIAARLLEAELKTEPRPAGGWDEVPPTFRLEGAKSPAPSGGAFSEEKAKPFPVSLVTEGLITLRKASERMAQVKSVRDLPRGEDGATRLARALLATDRVHFIVGLAVNPQQVDESGGPLRKGVVEDLVRDLEARGKIVFIEYV